MLKFHDIKVGDYLIADNDGDIVQGEVTNLKHGENQVCIDNGVQEFWYEMNQLSGILLDERQLELLKFTKQENADGSVKYLKGAFRILLPVKNDFSAMEIWYRDEKRHITHALFVHELQNHFYELTKVHLNTDSFE